MRARQLEVFTAVMRAGTVTEAARMLNISQPALSQVLRHAEDELGFALFAREKGRLHPTPEAQELYPEAERLFGELEGLRRMTADMKLGRTGLVRVGCSTPVAMSLLPRVMAAFRDENPDIALRCNVAPVQTLRTMLREGDAGMALALSDRMTEDIEVEVLGRTGFCCLLPKGHDLAALAEVSLEDLRDEMIISYRAGTRPFEELDKAARRAGQRFEARLEIDTSISAVGFVQAGLGIAVVDSLLPWGQFDNIEARPLVDSPSLPLALLTLRGKTLSRSAALMRDKIRALLTEGLPPL